MKVTLIYFKPSGKYYSTGEYETQQTAFHLVVREVEEMFKVGNNPGLVNFSRDRNHFDVVVEAFGIPCLIKSNDQLNRLVVD